MKKTLKSNNIVIKVHLNEKTVDKELICKMIKKNLIKKNF